MVELRRIAVERAARAGASVMGAVEEGRWKEEARQSLWLLVGVAAARPTSEKSERIAEAVDHTPALQSSAAAAVRRTLE